MDQALADKMVENAVLFCADKKFAGDLEQTVKALQKGRCDACQYLSFSLVRQISDYLGQMDKTVKAVYAFKPDRSPFSPTSETVTAGPRASGINLIAWVDRKSAALTALGTTLETVLTESRRRIGCVNATPACCNLDIHMVDDREVQEGRGFGVVVHSMYVRSMQVWSRLETLTDEGIAAVSQRAKNVQDVSLVFNPETAPEEMLFGQALAIEKMPANERISMEARLQEMKVVLIRRIISDHLTYIDIAKKWFTVEDLVNIRRNKIGYGKIGGKSAGLLLAARILESSTDEDIRSHLVVPRSYFLGSDLIYVFMSANNLSHWNEQKYKPEAQIRDDYPRIIEEFQAGEFPPDILEKLQGMLDEIGPYPIIVRSSSQLEDNFGTSFAGKYDSHFCPNQGTRQENLRSLTQAIARTYASSLKPDALLYRRSKGLADYDERMAVLIQVVQGDRFGNYYLPHAAGVAFSRNLYRWAPQIRKEAGFTRLVWGLGTRAVDRQANDFPRLVALSHPHLQPDDAPESIRRYSQQMVDLIDLEKNEFRSLPIHQVLKSNYGPLRYLAEIEAEGYFTPVRSRVAQEDIKKLVITFSELLKRTPFASRLCRILTILEQNYHGAVDLEFTLGIPDPYALQPDAVISLLQCRPQSHIKDTKLISIPKELAHDEVIFTSQFMVPQGYVANIRYVLFVPPEKYYQLCTSTDRNAVGRLVGKLNSLLPEKGYICVGPGRWGTMNVDLGVYVSYADITHSAALIELSGNGIGPDPEPSLGTHFFQDLMEAEIFPLALILDREGASINVDFFYNTPNSLVQFISQVEAGCSCIRLIDVASYRPNHHMELVMDDEKNQAVAFLVHD